MSVSFKMTPEGQRIQKELKELEKLMVAVGFPDGGDPSIAEYAAYNDLGTNRSPARPFLRNSAEKHKDEYNKFAQQAIKGIMSGGTAQGAIESLGAFAKGIVMEEITDGIYAPNSPITAARKAEKGASPKPLVDTGQMLDAVNFEVRKR
ncbi:MAG: hypothetical protein ACRDBO_00205 [Lachnospiraceae bacterium]